MITANTQGEFRFISIADPHFSEHTPPSWKVKTGKDYQWEMDATLMQVFDYAHSKHVDGILWPGDLFNLKSPTRNSLGFMRYIIAMFRHTQHGNWPLKHFAVAGNHDYRWNAEPSAEAYETQPLGVLDAAGCLTILTPEGIEFSAYPEASSAVPFHLRLAGSSYSFGSAAPVRDIKKGDSDYLMVVGHFPFGLTGGEMFGQQIFGPDYFKDSEGDCFVLGDNHADNGVFKDPATGKTFVAQGSISQIGESLASQRRPAAAYIVVKPEETTVSILRPKVHSLMELLDVNRQQEIQEEQASLDEYITNLKNTEFRASTPEEILKGLPTAEDIRSQVLLYLARAEAEAEAQ